MSGDTGIAGSEDCVNAIEPRDGAATAAGSSLIALAKTDVCEIVAAGALQEIAAIRSFVAELLRSSSEDSLRK
jgi:hypothetical protein